ncbi:MAG: UDP-N-acetylglucosamine 2-epimerase (non-hydrolyzing) [candidate division Zixibacteria bacterium]|nr:UDP-N-acetylglucosamine 2-epimerase (non-hydrolyzing) [candidate division Zixibacteria bacterium]
MHRVVLVVGTRPNMVKAAPLWRILQRHREQFDTYLVDTGQHYDYGLSGIFFDQLGLPSPYACLGVDAGTSIEQIAGMMVELEKVFLELQPHLVAVFGDVNSALAGALVAARMRISIAHVEAGLRSFDYDMPEEINRILIDRVADHLFVSEPSGQANLAREGVDATKLCYCGNIMIDSLVHARAESRKSLILDELRLEPKKYAVLTLHRPSNVDDPAILASLVQTAVQIGSTVPVIFPCHPRTRKGLPQFTGVDNAVGGPLRIIEPLGYVDFLRLQSDALFVLTDSGGVQEETTYLQVPCVTLRRNTERPVTVEVGSNVLAGTDPQAILAAVRSIMEGRQKIGRIPDLWDGRTAERVVQYLSRVLS